ncbi:MAG: hypothetical protein FWG36_10425 [Oscillospiraceae bacterium]|nr:hypothetical protein [Oscillospiraceae bacterium]
MKKLTLVLALLLLLTACATGGNGETSGTTQPTAAPAPRDTSESSAISDDTSPEDDVPAAVVNTTVIGEVYEAIGNLITLKVINMGDFNFGDGGGMTVGGNFDSEEMQDRFKEMLGEDYQEGMTQEDMMKVMQDRVTAMIESGELPEISFGDGGGGFRIDGGNFSGELPEGFQIPEGGMTFRVGDEGGPGGARRIELDYTGEEREIIIPIGVPIVTMSFGENGMEEKEFKLEAIKAGDIMSVTYDESGVKVTKVVIQQGGLGGMFQSRRVTTQG